MSRARAAALALLAALAGVPAQGSGPPGGATLFAAVDAVFADLDRPDVPGCVLGIIDDGMFAYRRGYGAANLDHRIPLDARSVFRMASVSKQFTAAAVALLAESGQVALDDPLRRHFPEFPPWADTVTIRHLVHHVGGVRDYTTLAWLVGQGGDEVSYTNAWVLDLIARQQATNFTPGTRWAYSNSGYLLLAHLVHRVSGQSLRDYAQANLFGPLGMGDSRFLDRHAEVVARRASGYAPDGEGFLVSETLLDMVGDGGLYTTLDDLLAWDRNWYANRLGRGDPGLVTLLATPWPAGAGVTESYAFGLDVRTHRGLRMLRHSGSWVGFRHEMARFPDQRVTVIVLCNRADAAPTPRALAVADLYLAAAPGDGAPFVREPEAGEGPPDGAQAPLAAAAATPFTGGFHSQELGADAGIAWRDGQLWLALGSAAPRALVPTGARSFASRDGVGIRFTGDDDHFQLDSGDERGIGFSRR